MSGKELRSYSYWKGIYRRYEDKKGYFAEISRKQAKQRMHELINGLPEGKIL